MLISKGAAGEVLAARFLREQGYDVLAGNYRTRFGEIDIIASDDEYIVFVEVKSREQDSYYLPREAVTAEKQRRIIRTALLFMSETDDPRQMRFDVIEVVTAKGEPMKALDIRHFENAFGG
jgi:putative endonuclease